MIRRIFISSTQRELAEERKAIVDCVPANPQLARFFSTFAFEFDVPVQDKRTDEVYLAELASSDIFEHCASHGLEPPIFEVDARHVSVTVIRPTFDEYGRKVGVKPITNQSEPITNRSEPITNRSEPITKIGIELPDDFDLRMAANRKDFRERAKQIWLRIARDSDVTVRELAQECGFGLASTQGALNALREAGLLEKTGKTHNGVWHVIVTPKGR